MRRVVGLFLLLIALAFVVGGVVTTFAPEGDLGRSNLIQIGLVYMLMGLCLGLLIGLCLGFGGALLARRK